MRITKKNVKIIHWLDWKLLTDMTFSMVMIIDGGFPVKKFINDRFGHSKY